jgi:NTP pyrophosphatase (non-canonical NTP hydrolase)
MNNKYYIYHIPGKKIGVTRNLNNRVTLVQGYKEGEYEVLDSSKDINYISDRERELQKSYGYKVDRKPYKNLFKLNKMRINATEQTSTFPCHRATLADTLLANKGLKWKTFLGEFELTDKSIKWILANAKTSMYNDDRTYIYNKAFYEAFLNVVHTPPAYNKKSLKIFQHIRDWAEERGLYETGDSNTQYIKLQEECGELAKALLKDDQPEIVDAIGDIVVVLTNLAHQKGTSIETCISSAYNEIKNRTGRMVNGTFVKDE